MPKAVTNINELNPEGTYTCADYLLWQFKERVELIRGKIFRMSPAPNRRHQQVSWALPMELGKALHQKSCNMFTAPFDVRLINHKKSTEDKQVYTVMQPDLCVICDADKLDERGAIGAPDLVVEILSPGNSKKEMDLKFDLYQENGVREYWMVNTTDNAVFVYVLENEKYIGLKPFTEDNVLQSSVFPELHFDVKDIFEN